jgi:hypothetical protein
MMKWLRQNADKYGLTKNDGNPNKQCIEEVVKIANLDSKGRRPAATSNRGKRLPPYLHGFTVPLFRTQLSIKDIRGDNGA